MLKPYGRWLWLGRAKSRADVSDGSECFAVSKPCGRYPALAKALSCRSSTDGRSIAKALRVKAVRTYRTGAKAEPCRSSAQTSGQAGRPRLRWALS